MVRSLGFGFNFNNYTTVFEFGLSAPLKLILKLAIKINLLAHYAKGTLSPLLIKKLQLIVSVEFQYFSESYTPSISPFLYSTCSLLVILIV